MGSEAGPDLRPYHLQKALPFCLHAGGPPSHQCAHLGTQPSTETAPGVLRVAGGDRSPTGHRVLAWEEPCFSGLGLLFHVTICLSGGLHIRLHVALCLPNPHHQTQQTHRKQAPRSPQMPPKRSSGFLEESPEPTASGVLGLGFTWGPHRGSCSSDTCQPPAPAFLAGRMRGLVSIPGVGRSEGSRENHLCTQLYPHFSVGSVLLPELSVQSRPPFRVSQQARGQQAGHHGATGSCFPGSRRCARGPGTGGRGSSRQPPPPTPEAVLHAPGWRCPDASTQCPCPGHNHVPTPWPALQCPLDLGPGGAQVRPRDSPPAVSAAGSAAAGLSSGSPGSILRETQERLVTGGDGRLGCSPHTKGEASKGSHAGPTSVVGKQGLGRPQLLPHGRSQL